MEVAEVTKIQSRWLGPIISKILFMIKKSRSAKAFSKPNSETQKMKILKPYLKTKIKVKEKILKHRTCLWISQIIKKVLVPMQPLMFDLTTEMSHTLATKRPSRI